MLYEEARVYLDHVSKYGSVLGLESIKSLLDKLENPQKDLTFIQIAGTNGKGSILCYLSEILTSNGYKTGRYSSPAVMEELEYIQVDGMSISPGEMGKLTERVKEAADKLVREGKPEPTLFEVETAIALLYFKEQSCKYVILEAGLGGNLDATNVVEHTVLDVFAPIGMDHMNILGKTPEEIAEKKSGIIKPEACVVTAPQSKAVLAVIEDRAEKTGCPVYRTEADQIKIKETDLSGQTFTYKQFENIKINMTGKYQTENAATAIEAALALRDRGVAIEDRAIIEGLRNARWRGRFDVLSTDPLFIIDGAHNEDAAVRLAENIRDYLPGRRISAIVGVFKDKDYSRIIQLVAPYVSIVYPIELPKKDRTLSKAELTKEWEKYAPTIRNVDSLDEAVRQSMDNAGEEDAILAFGSLSYLGKVKKLVEERVEDHGGQK